MDENEIARSIGRVEGKLDMLISMHKKDGVRISQLEKKQWLHTGGIGVIAFILNKIGLPAGWS